VLGIAEFKLGKLDSAEQRFREAMRLGPLYQESFENLLRILLAKKKFSEIRAMVTDRYSYAEAPAVIARIAGRASLENEKWLDARQWLESSFLKTDDASIRGSLLNDIGVTHSRTEQHSRAAEIFREAFQLAQLPVAGLNRGRALLSADRVEEAIKWLYSLNDYEWSDSFDFRRLLVGALLRTDATADALELAKPLLDHPSADPDLFAMVSAAYSDNVREFGAAIEIATRGLRSFPDNRTLKNNLAYALLLAGRWQEAEIVLSNMEAASGRESVHLIATRGLLELAKGNIQGGEILYNRALRASTNSAMRERVSAKRDLEIAKALSRSGQDSSKVLRLLRRAAAAGKAAWPYNAHANEELKRLAP
jgi:tetratricopeptide (TPR) repeat protein